jgi:hypothetical protein
VLADLNPLFPDHKGYRNKILQTQKITVLKKTITWWEAEHMDNIPMLIHI